MAKTFDADALRQKIKDTLKDTLASVLAPLDEELAKQKAIRDEAEARITELERIRAQATGDGRARQSSGGGTRVRRTADDLKADAAAAVKAIEAAGKDGISAADIKKAVPGMAKEPSIMAFLDKHAGKGHGVKRTGTGPANTRFVSK